MAFSLRPAFLVAALCGFAGILVVPAAKAETEIVSWTGGKELPKSWRTIGGKWDVRDDCLKQVHPGNDDPNKVVLVAGDIEDFSGGIVVTAKLRIDQWKDDDWARAGVSGCSDPMSGHGLNLVYHHGKLQFVHDYVAWGPGCDFPVAPGKWYWIKLHKTAVEMKGKA